MLSLHKLLNRSDSLWGYVTSSGGIFKTLCKSLLLSEILPRKMQDGNEGAYQKMLCVHFVICNHSSALNPFWPTQDYIVSMP
jgi:hypothetical protein